MFCWYLRNTYLENKLREPGATVQCGEPVDLGAVEVPAYLYGSREDHIVPWQTAYKSTELLGGDLRFVLGACGHIAGVINPPAKKKRTYWIDARSSPTPAVWLEQARSEHRAAGGPTGPAGSSRMPAQAGSCPQERRQPQVPGHRARARDATSRQRPREPRKSVLRINGEHHGRHRHRRRRPHRGGQVRRHARQDPGARAGPRS